ncbi:uncharacterized protein LOC124270072 [Haliotis rubra]|uniref:uncharacterized protein LOC124270072 n=1 Tax=Haliotis rubra TaxID=36100 RepID=UPI001EE5020D|nr:uncharacterized protein LOC124270072 [Haliotis rubra]
MVPIVPLRVVTVWTLASVTRLQANVLEDASLDGGQISVHRLAVTVAMDSTVSLSVANVKETCLVTRSMGHAIKDVSQGFKNPFVQNALMECTVMTACHDVVSVKTA